MTRRVLSILVMILLVATSAFAAEYVNLVNSRAGQNLSFYVTPARSFNGEASTQVDITIPGFYKEEVRVGTETYLKISLPKSSIYNQKGLPALPKLTANFMLSDGGKPIARIISVEKETIKLDYDVLPSKGPITRNINPETVAYTFDKVYGQNEFWPNTKENAVKFDKPFIFRDIRGVSANFNVFSYNAGTKELQVIKKITVEVLSPSYTYGEGNNIKLRRRSAPAKVKEYARIYKNVFANYEMFAPMGYDHFEDGLGRLLIIAYDDFYKAAFPLYAWKKKLGFDAKIVKLSEVGSTNTDIKNYIQNEYNSNGLSYVILVGDSEQVPTNKGVKERADSDPCYVKLEGNDNIPDAMISRLSAKTSKDVAVQVAKIINYEQFPSEGADAKWYRRGLGIASNQGSPTDYARANKLKKNLLTYNYEEINDVYDPSASASKVAGFINDGLGIINYIGHGSKYMWVSSRFSTSDIPKLKNENMLPIIWSVACVNGDFVGGSDCFGETWLKAGTVSNPKGAVMCYASSTNQEWVPPCVVQEELNDIIVKESHHTVGGIVTNGLLKGFETYGSGNTTSGTMLMEQWHIFGDCSMMIRTDAPKKLKCTVDYSGGMAKVKVTYKGKAFKGATVCVYSEKFKNAQVATTNSKGTCELFFTKSGKAFVTVSGFNVVPVVDKEF